MWSFVFWGVVFFGGLVGAIVGLVAILLSIVGAIIAAIGGSSVAQ